MTPHGPPRMHIQKCIQVPLKLIRNSIAKCPPKSATRAIFFENFIFGSGIKKICLGVFTGCQGLAGRKIFQPISHRNCTRDSKLDLSMHCSHEGPPMMYPSADLLPAQRLTAGDAQKLTFRFLNVSEEFS